MSKWVNKELFNKFKENKQVEQDNEPKDDRDRLFKTWRTPEKGTITKPKVYEGRFIPDPKGRFYEKYFYHMFKLADGSWHFSLCPKTHDMGNFCEWCTVSSKLYMSGSSADKRSAKNYSRKTRFCSNWYVIRDPRDAEVENEERKVSGKVLIYEFPGKVESKLKTEITDETEGYGLSIFDPGQSGHNFILRIKSTKQDKNKQVYPDYAESSFSKNESALADSEQEIEEIMSLTHDLIEHIQSMETPKATVIEILKKEMVYDLITDELKENKIIDSSKEEDVSVEELNNNNDLNDNSNDDYNNNSSDDDDFNLLKELEDDDIPF